MKFRLIFICVCAFTLSSRADIRLPRLIRDSMILQRDANPRLWGWANPGETVTIRFNGAKITTKTSDDGRWECRLPKMKAGGPFTMELSGKNRITLHDIYLGDVYFCSGQSNMVHQMSLHAERYKKDIETANLPLIRQFLVPSKNELKMPAEDLANGSWQAANPVDVRNFSAVAFFFARDIFERYHIPIGIINASVGGTPVEAWMSEEGLSGFGDIAATIAKNKLAFTPPPANPPIRLKPADEGLVAKPAWFDTSYVPVRWRPFYVPGYWEDQGVKNLHGTVWFRREINVPAKMIGKPAVLALGRIVDAETVYLNGKVIGNTTYQYPQRRYPIAENMLHPGKNLLVIRVTNFMGKGGFVPDKPYYIRTANDTLDITGLWHYRVGEVFLPEPVQPASTSAQNSPTALYNAMVAPVTPFVTKAVLWYQGESNAGNPSLYARLMPAFISNWRNKFKQPELPFFIVQLPNFMEVNYLPSESNWAMLRESQLQTLSIPHTYVAVTIDLGEWNDIHPDRKKDVGDRLALLARKELYGETELVASGPIYERSTITGSTIVISFKNIGTGLASGDGEALQEFAIAGDDKKFVWANARIEDGKVIVWNDSISAPMYVRYAWADNPANPNLGNKEGLPASPFRTDK